MELVIASLPPLLDRLTESTKNLIELVNRTVHKMVELNRMGMKVPSEGKTVCKELLVVTNNFFNYMQAINDFTLNVRNKQQQLAFKEAAKEESPNFKPLNEYIQHIKQYLVVAGEKYEILHESRKNVVEKLGEVAEKIQKQANEEKTTGQVTGGVLATGIGVALVAGIPTLGIGTIIGLGTGAVAAAVGSHYVFSKHYSEKKIALQNLTVCTKNLEEQASQLNHVLDQVSMAMNSFDKLIQDVKIYMPTPHQRESLLYSTLCMRLLSTRMEAFHSVSSKCYETQLKSQNPLMKQLESVEVDDDSV